MRNPLVISLRLLVALVFAAAACAPSTPPAAEQADGVRRVLAHAKGIT